MKKLVRFSGKKLPLLQTLDMSETQQPSAPNISQRWQHFSSLSFQLMKAGLMVLAFFLLGTTQSNAQIYDLSLTQSVDKDSVGVGDTVTFTLTVDHEAGDLASGVVVTDSISSNLEIINITGGFAIQDPSTNKLTWSLADISSSSGAQSITIETVVLSEGIHFAIAEITTSPFDSDSEANNQNFLEDDIAASCVSAPIKLCAANQDSILVSAPTGATNVQWYRIFDVGGDGSIGAGDTITLVAGNDITVKDPGTYYFTADLGSCQAGNCCPMMVEPACMDLALTKMLTTTGTIVPGDTVEFLVKIYNQGDIYTDSIQIHDYLPDSLNLVSENGWTLEGTGDTTATNLLTVADNELDAGGLAPMDSVSVAIRAVIPSDFKGTSLVNFAEISNQTDIYGNELTDSDSSDDTNRANDGGGEPNGLTDNVVDNSNGDEDDHDPAFVTVQQFFDLALTKTLATGQSATVNAGDTVDFTITVSNQGALTATNTEITDYVPADMD